LIISEIYGLGCYRQIIAPAFLAFKCMAKIVSSIFFPDRIFPVFLFLVFFVMDWIKNTGLIKYPFWNPDSDFKKLFTMPVSVIFQLPSIKNTILLVKPYLYTPYFILLKYPSTVRN